ncbi:MAG: 2-amino-4-hydroxy-6-hydroxymethyldihydropteridine diphosphokinase [Bacteroidota bacterium]|nr:2-amino-4-hydroxy-6-hydroxymethyldihydropteridine diphosphokinase [Bacteroidota bacterium]
MHKAYIGIGTNIEPRMERMEQALIALGQFGMLARKSSLYETAPVGFTEQPDFVNAVVLLETELELPEVHEALKLLEKQLGRTDRPRWHEREIDFDILFFDDIIVDSPKLIVPHAEVQNRAFVLVPMNEIASDLRHPVFQKTVAELLDELSFDTKSIHPIPGNV